MKTIILFICHTINEESIFRYNILKSAADKLGYDLVWQLDITNYKNYDFSELNKTINFQFLDPIKISKDEYLKKFEYNKKFYNHYFWINGQLFLFYFLKNSTINYDYIWFIEYDVMYYGNWLDFFKQYENDDSDLVTAQELIPYKYNDEWFFWPNNQILQKYGYGNFYHGLNCIARYSNNYTKTIQKFYLDNNYNNDLHAEATFKTIALLNKLKINFIKTYNNEYTWKYFSLDKNCETNHLYHAVKLNQSTKQLLTNFYI